MRPDLEKIAAEYGVRNLRFFIPIRPSMSLAGFGLPIGMTSSSDPEYIVECEVEEERYKVADGYKIQLRPVNRGDGEPYYFADERFYQSDLENLMRRHPDEYRVFVLVDEDDKYERIRF